MSRLRGQALRFLLVGGANTALTYVIFFLLGLVIPAAIAYAIAFVLGLVWVAFGSSRLVFQFRGHLVRIGAFVAAYVVVFAIGQLVIYVIDPRDAGALALTTVAVLVMTTPLTFVAGRLILTNRSDTLQSDAEERA